MHKRVKTHKLLTIVNDVMLHILHACTTSPTLLYSHDDNVIALLSHQSCHIVIKAGHATMISIVIMVVLLKHDFSFPTRNARTMLLSINKATTVVETIMTTILVQHYCSANDIATNCDI